MGEYRGFSYATSRKGSLLLDDYARQKKDYIMSGYGFIENPGETAAFEDMLDLASQGEAKSDKLYIETLKDLPAQGFEQFRDMVHRLYDAGLRTIHSIEEPGCTKTADLMAAVDVFVDLLPEFRRRENSLVAGLLFGADVAPEEISRLTGLPLSAVHEAIGSYLKEQEGRVVEEGPAGEEVIEVEAED